MTYENTWKTHKDPWFPPDYDEDVIGAVRAFSMGIATISQQKLVWAYLMYVCKSSDEFADLSFRPGPDGEKASTFAEGKRFVGMQIRKLLRPELNPKSKDQEAPQPLTRRQIAQGKREKQGEEA